jgi:short-subunit dehydrogenase
VAAASNAAPDVTFLVNNAGNAAFEDAISAPTNKKSSMSIARKS